MEDQMFSSSTEEGVKMFLRANETVHVPFKFQSFVSFSATPEMVSNSISNEYPICFILVL